MPSLAFLAHSSKNKEFALRLARDLREHGVEVWIDEFDLHIGEDLGAISTVIARAQYLVVVLSVEARRSAWVQKEVETARASGVAVLPVVLEEPAERIQGDLAELAIADFRSSYRRALSRLIQRITENEAPFLAAKEAARLLKNERAVAGDLFGLSQQGVATLYSLANRKDWLFADALEGLSQLWFVEIYNRRDGSVHPFCIKGRRVHDLPVLHLLDCDPSPVPHSAIVVSCAVNELPGLSESEARRFIDDHPQDVSRIDRRYTRYRPVPFTRPFVDSDVAVASASTGPEATRLLGERADELFLLTKLEVERRHGNAALWSVSFFDPALAESVLTVGVDAATGRIKYPAMQPEILNADFLSVSTKGDDFVISLANQQRAVERHAWHIPGPGGSFKPFPTAADALRWTRELLGDEADRWQLAFLSNTGVVEPVVSRYGMSVERLMRSDGTAGQWVVELCGVTGTPVSDGGRSGFNYLFRQLLITREDGATIVKPDSHLALTVPLHRCPLPPGLIHAYEEARDLAVRSVEVEFEAMSAALARPSDGPQWWFRFYDTEEVLVVIQVTGDGGRVLSVQPKPGPQAPPPDRERDLGAG